MRVKIASNSERRHGDSYLSPKIQRDTIERIAREKGIELGEIIEEQDVSGGKKIRDRGLGRLVDKIEAGESDGLIVWKVSRFSRNLLDAVETMTNITKGGGRLLADDFDSNAPMSKALLGLLAGLAEEQLDARREDFAEARRRAIERGVYVAAAPPGYRRGPDGRLVVHEREARKVREAFERRANSESLTTLAREYGWLHIHRLLASDTYLGVARSGDEYVNETAHPPIVSIDLFERANAPRSTRPTPTGETTRDRLLIGLARCAGCGATLKVTRRTNRRGEPLPDAYYCRDLSKARCPSRAFVHCEILDQHVAAWFEQQLVTNPAMIDAVAATQELDEALADEAEAQEDLSNYVTAVKVTDPAVFQLGLEAREARLAGTQARVREAKGRVGRLPEGGSLLDLWHRFDVAERRLALGEWLSRVEVSRGATADLASHVQIFWLDGLLADDEDDAGVAAA
jgi:DNA invertase Pin-like site-specific DNA recombinase